MKRRNRISGQWSSRLIEMLESPAYRALSVSAHRVIDRIAIELAHHGGNDSQRLPVTTEDFVAYGMHRDSVAPAIREATALGFIRITERGHGGNAEHGSPNLFALTFDSGRDGHRTPPTHDWRSIKTIEEAERTAKEVRQAKNEIAVAKGKRAWQRRVAKQNPGTDFSAVSVRKNRTETSNLPIRKNRTTGSVGKTVLLSISRGGGAQRTASAVPALPAHRSTVNGGKQ
jgi:hypothetical protein